MASTQILLATYNGETYLAEQLDSILAQDTADWELLIRDGGSGDGTVALLQHYAARHPDRIRLLPGQGRAGCLQNFAALLDAADADILMFADQDDFWLPDKVRRSVARLRAMTAETGDATPLLVHTDAKVVDAGLHEIAASRFAFAGLPADGYDPALLLAESPTIGCTFAFNRALAELARPLPAEAGAHDSYLALLAAVFGRIDVVREPTMLYRQHGRNVSGANQLRYGAMIRSACDLGKLRETLTRFHYRPARAIYERYGEAIPEASRAMLRDFGNFDRIGFWRRKRLLWRYSIRKSHFLRNLGFRLLA